MPEVVCSIQYLELLFKKGVFQNSTEYEQKMKYYKRQWNEKRGDKYENWRTLIWYFEIGEREYLNKQIEKYENEKALKYDLENMEDEFGRPGDHLIKFAEIAEFEITKEEFNKE